MMQNLSMINDIPSWTENQIKCLDCFSLLHLSQENDMEKEFCNQRMCNKYFGKMNENHMKKRYFLQN